MRVAMAASRYTNARLHTRTHTYAHSRKHNTRARMQPVLIWAPETPGGRGLIALDAAAAAMLRSARSYVAACICIVPRYAFFSARLHNRIHNAVDTFETDPQRHVRVPVLSVCTITCVGPLRCDAAALDSLHPHHRVASPVHSVVTVAGLLHPHHRPACVCCGVLGRVV